MVDFGVTMLDFSRDEPGAENASIAYHEIRYESDSAAGHIRVTGSFPERKHL